MQVHWTFNTIGQTRRDTNPPSIPHTAHSEHSTHSSHRAFHTLLTPVIPHTAHTRHSTHFSHSVFFKLLTLGIPQTAHTWHSTNCSHQALHKLLTPGIPQIAPGTPHTAYTGPNVRQQRPAMTHQICDLSTLNVIQYLSPTTKTRLDSYRGVRLEDETIGFMAELLLEGRTQQLCSVLGVGLPKVLASHRERLPAFIDYALHDGVVPGLDHVMLYANNQQDK